MKTLKFGHSETAALCYSLEYLMHAGISGADALTLIGEEEKRAGYREIYRKMAEEADAGTVLSQVFSSAGCFEPYVCDMIATGERTGRVEEALESVASSCEKKDAMEKHMRSALVYPCVLMLIMLAVIAVVLIYVMPVFDEVYAQLGSGLTGLAAGLLGAGQALRSISPVLLVLFGAAVAFLAAFSGVASFRAKVINALFRSGRENSVAEKVNTANFALGLSMGISSGLDVEEAVQTAAKLPGRGSRGERKAAHCMELLSAGKSMTEALKESGLLPPSECRMLEAGIRGGSGDRAMEQIAARLQQESEEAIGRRVARFEPAIVIIASLLTGMILLSVMLPLINIMSAIG